MGARAKSGHDGGVVGATRLLVQRLVEIIPIGIHAVDQADFPGARPVLQVALALDRQADVVEPFVINESLQAVGFCEAVDESSRCCHTRRERLLVTPRYSVPLRLFDIM